MAGTSCWRLVFLRFLSGVCVDSFGVGLRLALQALYLICHDVKLSVKTKPRPFVCLFVAGEFTSCFYLIGGEIKTLSVMQEVI